MAPLGSLAGEVEPGASTVSALDGLYRVARTEFDADPAFADRARARVVALQAGDEATLGRWREIVDESELAFREIYGRLGVLLEPGDSAGESFYNQWLPEVVEELLAAGVATYSDGAVVVESEEVKAPDGQPAVLMVQKRDGGYGYDTTDLATLRYRVRDLKADRILYVVDARQALHFRLIFEAARRMGWLARGNGHEGVEAVHVAFGTVLGPDGRPFKTRAGGTVRLMHLIDEAVDSARRTVAEREPDLPPAELDRIAEQAGVGAVKYADLSTSRVKDYTFDIARMVSLTGNTSVYLQYAHARICSILRKAGETETAPDPGLPMHPAERALVLALDEFGDVLRDVARGERTAPAVQLPVRDGEGVHRLLRELPGAPGGGGRPGEPAGAVPARRGDAARRARATGHRGAGAHVDAAAHARTPARRLHSASSSSTTAVNRGRGRSSAASAGTARAGSWVVTARCTRSLVVSSICAASSRANNRSGTSRLPAAAVSPTSRSTAPSAAATDGRRTLTLPGTGPGTVGSRRAVGVLRPRPRDAGEPAEHDVVAARRGNGVVLALDGMDPQLVAGEREPGDGPALVVLILGEAELPVRARVHPQLQRLRDWRRPTARRPPAAGSRRPARARGSCRGRGGAGSSCRRGRSGR